MMRTLTAGHAESDEFRLRLGALLQSGMCITTDYSGFECAREALTLGVKAYFMLHSGHSKVSSNINFRRPCDVAPLPSSILLHIVKQLDENRSCVFVGIVDRLPEAAKARVLATMPEEGAPDKEVAEAYREIEQYLENNKEWCFSPHGTCNCLTHQRDFPVHPLAAELYPHSPRTAPASSWWLAPLAVRLRGRRAARPTEDGRGTDRAGGGGTCGGGGTTTYV